MPSTSLCLLQPDSHPQYSSLFYSVSLTVSIYTRKTSFLTPIYLRLERKNHDTLYKVSSNYRNERNIFNHSLSQKSENIMFYHFPYEILGNSKRLHWLPKGEYFNFFHILFHSYFYQLQPSINHLILILAIFSISNGFQFNQQKLI